jgi:hypothetical protein
MSEFTPRRITFMPLQNALILGIAAMILHEMAHVSVALALHVKVHQVGINWKGFYVRRASGTAVENLAITLAGPGINLLLALLLHHMYPHFALCHLAIGVRNLVNLSGGSVATSPMPVAVSSVMK